MNEKEKTDLIKNLTEKSFDTITNKPDSKIVTEKILFLDDAIKIIQNLKGNI